MNLYNKIYNAVNEGIQKALIIDPEQNDVSINYSYHKINNKTDIKFIIQSYVKEKNYKGIYDITSTHDEKDFLHIYQFDRCDFDLFIKKYIAEYPDANLNWIDTSNITSMSSLFADSNFTGNISKWDVSHVISFMNMFDGCSLFNGDISNWKLNQSGDFINMQEMFANSVFDQPISKWNVKYVNQMNGMFRNSQFNQIISNWDVSNVKWMHNMFSNSQFNQDLSEWGDKLQNCYDFDGMFSDSRFHYDISNWDIPEYVSVLEKKQNKKNETTMKNMFTLSKENYDKGYKLFPVEYMPKAYLMHEIYKCY